MYYKTVSVTFALPSAMVVEATVQFPDVKGIYRIDVGEDTFGNVDIERVFAIVTYSGDYISRVTIRVKGKIRHSYGRVDNDYTVYEHGRFVDSFPEPTVERLEEDNNDAR